MSSFIDYRVLGEQAVVGLLPPTGVVGIKLVGTTCLQSLWVVGDHFKRPLVRNKDCLFITGA